jgi:hypothetical protein
MESHRENDYFENKSLFLGYAPWLFLAVTIGRDWFGNFHGCS